VGQGAMDDGCGVLMALEAVKAMIDIGLKPKRTVRQVFFHFVVPSEIIYCRFILIFVRDFTILFSIISLLMPKDCWLDE
jgi:hypothetical protein